MTIKVQYNQEEVSIPVRIKSNNEAHWACGKVNCDCDEQFELSREQ